MIAKGKQAHELRNISKFIATSTKRQVMIGERTKKE
jgi:hypothetical protein